jgi:hypothetical protein
MAECRRKDMIRAQFILVFKNPQSIDSKDCLWFPELIRATQVQPAAAHSITSSTSPICAPSRRTAHAGEGVSKVAVLSNREWVREAVAYSTKPWQRTCGNSALTDSSTSDKRNELACGSKMIDIQVQRDGCGGKRL